MYIWRSKNRRDRRDLRLSGPFQWTAPKGEYNTEAEDDLLRHEGEALHVGYFRDRIRIVMHQYLNSENGKKEVDLLITALDEAARRVAQQRAEEEALQLQLAKKAKKNGEKPADASSSAVAALALTSAPTATSSSISAKGEDAPDDALAPPPPPPPITKEEALRRKNIHEIYRKYDADGSDGIDVHELKTLLTQLRVNLSEDELAELFASLDVEEEGEIDFECFYAWFVKEAEGKKKKKGFLSRFRRGDDEGEDSGEFKRLLFEVQARNLSMDQAVWRATEDARIEYRKAHPPRFCCPDPHCAEAFPTKKLLDVHTRGTVEHAERDHARKELEDSFRLMEDVLAGPLGRNILANRLLFSIELGNMQTRIAAARETPFRPMVNDPGAVRSNQLLKGMLVTGADAKAGIRAGYRQNRLVSQHRAPGRRADQPLLQDVVASLLHVRDETIDIVTAPTASSHAEVLFIWKGHAKDIINLVGDFNGWKEEEMTPNSKTGRCCLIKQLGPGKYRYRYVIDGEDQIDEESSVVDDGEERFRGTGLHRKRHGMGGKSNILLVINPATQKDTRTALIPHVNRRGDGLGGNISDRSMSTLGSSVVLSVDKNSPWAVDNVKRKGIQNDAKNGRDEGDHDLAAMPADPTMQIVPSFAADINSTKPHYYTNNPAAITLPPPPQSHELEGMTKINLRNMILVDDGAWAFAAFLQRNSHIKQIDISNNEVSDEGMQALASALPMLLKLECLKLNGNKAGYDGCRYLSKPLRLMTTLVRFEMSGNPLGDDGCEILSNTLIKTDTSVKEIFLNSCYIGNDGAGVICDSLQHNKVLLILSLKSNRIYTEGCAHFAPVIEQNATLRELYLSDNPLGPDGIKVIGDALNRNDTLLRLDLSNADLLRGHSGLGLNALLLALRVNSSLKYLGLRNSNIGHFQAIDAAYSLTFNKGLFALDLAGNPIGSQWFQPDLYIRTHILDKMPSIQTSLDRIAKLYATPESAARFNKEIFHSQREVDPSFDGYWTNMRKWKRVNRKAEERRALQLLGSKEEVRIQLEKEHVDETVRAHLITLSAFLDHPNCYSFVSTLAKLIRAHIDNLTQLAPPIDANAIADANANDGTNNANANANSAVSKMLEAEGGLDEDDDNDGDDDNTNANTNANNNTNNNTKGDTSAGLAAKMQHPETASEKAERKEREKQERAAKKEADRIAALIPFNDADFNVTHTAVCRAVFAQCHADPHSLQILPSQLQKALLLLALPASHADTQHAVTLTQVPKRPFISFKKFMHYTKLFGGELVAASYTHRYTRSRIDIDLYFNPPLLEAKSIILAHAEYIAMREITRDYRYGDSDANTNSNSGHTTNSDMRPLFVCGLCSTRFASVRQYEKHLKEGARSAEHLKLMQLEEVHAAQAFMLRRAKHMVTGTFFPCFFELSPVLPEEYTAQVYDSLGEGGRPIGVIEPQTTVLAEDVLGDFLQISFQGLTGWVRCRIIEERPSIFGTTKSKINTKTNTNTQKSANTNTNAGNTTNSSSSSSNTNTNTSSSSVGLMALFKSQPRYRRVLRTACQGVRHFSWERLAVTSKPLFYQVRDDPSLPRGLEIKVRSLPLLSAPIIGYLKLGQVVQSRAALNGVWLQIRYREHDAAWVVAVVGGGEHKYIPPDKTEAELIAESIEQAREARRKLKEEMAAMTEQQRQRKRKEIRKKGGLAAILTKEEKIEVIEAGLMGAEMFRVLHSSVQWRLTNTINYSPYTPKEADLVVDLDFVEPTLGAIALASAEGGEELPDVDDAVSAADSKSEAASSRRSRKSKGSQANESGGGLGGHGEGHGGGDEGVWEGGASSVGGASLGVVSAAVTGVGSASLAGTGSRLLPSIDGASGSHTKKR